MSFGRESRDQKERILAARKRSMVTVTVSCLGLQHLLEEMQFTKANLMKVLTLAIVILGVLGS